MNNNNGFSTGEEDSRGPTDQICCLIDDSERCRNAAGNASYSKRIQKTVTTRRLKLSIDPQVNMRKISRYYLCQLSHVSIISIIIDTMYLVLIRFKFVIVCFSVSAYLYL